MKYLANAVIEITGSSSMIEYVENRDIDNIRRRRINISKAASQLHYQPTFTVERGLKSTVHWFLQSMSKTATGILTVANLFVA